MGWSVVEPLFPSLRLLLVLDFDISSFFSALAALVGVWIMLVSRRVVVGPQTRGRVSLPIQVILKRNAGDGV